MTLVNVFVADPVASPTGFPFKTVHAEGSISDPANYAARERLCDLGYLHQAYRTQNGTVGYRCPGEPVENYVRKGGAMADAVGRKCLCNELANIARFGGEGRDSYSFGDVIESLLA